MNRSLVMALDAMRALLHHPQLAPDHAEELRCAALALAAGASIHARGEALRGRLERCRAAVELCGSQLGLVEPVVFAHAALWACAEQPPRRGPTRLWAPEPTREVPGLQQGALAESPCAAAR